MSKRTMGKFDEMRLTPVEGMTPEDIRELRLIANLPSKLPRIWPISMSMDLTGAVVRSA